MSMHLCKRGFMPGYNIWTEHGEQPVSKPTLEHEYDNQTADGLDEMLADFGDAIHSVDEEPTADVKAFYDINHILSNLQSAAMHCGMPLEAVPSPLPPPPPTYVVSPSPNPSPDNVSLMKSSLHTCQVHFV